MPKYFGWGVNWAYLLKYAKDHKITETIRDPKNPDKVFKFNREEVAAWACEDIIEKEAGLTVDDDAIVRAVYVDQPDGTSTFYLGVIVLSYDRGDPSNYLPGPPKPEVIQKLKEAFGFRTDPKWFVGL